MYLCVTLGFALACRRATRKKEVVPALHCSGEDQHVDQYQQLNHHAVHFSSQHAPLLAPLEALPSLTWKQRDISPAPA
jgi:hypothetical protein